MKVQNCSGIHVCKATDLNIAIACSLNGVRILFHDEIMKWIFTIFSNKFLGATFSFLSL